MALLSSTIGQGVLPPVFGSNILPLSPIRVIPPAYPGGPNQVVQVDKNQPVSANGATNPVNSSAPMVSPVLTSGNLRESTLPLYTGAPTTGSTASLSIGTLIIIVLAAILIVKVL